ncbi:MAG: aminopeptidase [Bdellovibrionales bacterium]|nr:aminopeptidase [Bdellovibrionales bacterium]
MTYYMKSAYNQAKILNARVSIDKALENQTLNENTKHKLRLALDARQFSEQNLGLKATQNYTTFADIGRPYVSWIVHASPAFELKHHLWKFPIVGSLPYKGFFSEEEAKQEAQIFSDQNFDTYVRGVTAYSTLGWFEDPILNTMMNYSDHDLVNLIIHETVHTTLYIKSQAEFNEQLASFIGNIGTELFYRAKEGSNSQTLELISRQSHDEKIFSDFISQEIDELTKWYQTQQSSLNTDAKKIRLEQINERFKSNILPKMKTAHFRFFSQQELNNAKLLALKTYVYDLSVFERVFDKLNRNFSDFLKLCKSLEKERDPKSKIEEFGTTKNQPDN